MALGMLAARRRLRRGHARLLAQREEIEAGAAGLRPLRRPAPHRAAPRRGARLDPRLHRRAPRAPSPSTRAHDGEVERFYPLGQAGANLDRRRRATPTSATTPSSASSPTSSASRARLCERGELHPAGTDLGLTLCCRPTAPRLGAPARDRPPRRGGRAGRADRGDGGLRLHRRPDQPPDGHPAATPPRAPSSSSPSPPSGGRAGCRTPPCPAPRASASARAPPSRTPGESSIPRGDGARGDARLLLQHHRGADGAPDARAAGRAGLRGRLPPLRLPALCQRERGAHGLPAGLLGAPTPTRGPSA